MKFSYSLLKKLVPSLPSKAKIVELLNLHVFEAKTERNDTIDVSVPPNRFSDASSHIGIARELSALLRLKFPMEKKLRALLSSGALGAVAGAKGRSFSVRLNTKDCTRYTAASFENVKVKSSPPWIVRALRACGIRPLSNVVDIMNYVMLETGQPLHAFDGDKIENGKIIVRSAKKGETMTALSGEVIVFDGSELLIADALSPLGLAGIKGGKRAEVSSKTRRVIVEAANFDSTRIYRTSRRLGLLTDAAQRFSRQISPALTQIAILRASELLKEIAGAKEKEIVDVYPVGRRKRTVRFSADKISAIAGRAFSKNEIVSILTRLGFSIEKGSRIVVPPLREDIETIEDIAEEVVRVFGYDRIAAVPPRVSISQSSCEESITLKDIVRGSLKGLGYDEIYTSSFISREEGEKYENTRALAAPSNPLSGDYFYLRPSLAVNLVKSARENMKFLSEVRIFEIGHAFQKSALGIEEIPLLCMAAVSPKEDMFFSLKGEWSALLGALGVFGIEFAERRADMFDMVHGKEKETVGYILRVAEKGGAVINVLEARLDALLKIVSKERKFVSLPRYPAIVRDLSIAAGRNFRIGDLMRSIHNTDARIKDISIIDEYGENITFRIVFQSRERTLTDKEADEVMDKITPRIKNDFGLKVR